MPSRLPARTTKDLQDNMQLLGLDAEDKGRSLFTCVKELFENAVDARQNADACQNAHPCFDEAAHSHSIEVAVVPIDDRPDFYSVRIGDTGCGFSEERLAAVGALYSSSKSKGPRASASAGGLTLMEAGESDFAAASAGGGRKSAPSLKRSFTTSCSAQLTRS